MSSQHGHKTWIEISRSAVENNIAALRSFLTPESVFCAVLKANAYGHGQHEMTDIVCHTGIDHIAVDSIDEAITLRQDAPNATIFILGYTVPERLADVVAIDAIQTVYDEVSVSLLATSARSRGGVARISVKIETGLHRQGVGPRGLATVLDAVRKASDYVRIDGVSSHFASAEEPTDQMNAHQLDQFLQAISVIEAAGHAPRYRHIACSAAAMAHPASQLTMSRFGIALYGLWSGKNLKRHVVLGRQNVELTPVLSLKTRVAQIKDVPAGSGVGYGSTYIANRPIRLAVLPIGYADGIDRALSNKGEVIIRGRRCPIVGNICMNMCMVDASAVAGIAQDDIVTVLGRDGMHTISAEDHATIIGTIDYEVVTRLSALLPRVIC